MEKNGWVALFYKCFYLYMSIHFEYLQENKNQDEYDDYEQDTAYAYTLSLASLMALGDC